MAPAAHAREEGARAELQARAVAVARPAGEGEAIAAASTVAD